MKIIIVNLYLITFFMFYGNILSTRITMIQLNGGSKDILSKVVGEELAKRGHEVTICVPVKKDDSRINTMAVENSLKRLHFYQGFEQEEYDSSMTNTSSTKTKSSLSQLGLGKKIGFQECVCTQLVSDPQVIENIKNSDLLISQINLICGGAIAKIFKKRWVGLSPSSFAEILSAGHRVYLNPSYQPTLFSTLTDNMNFFQRVKSYLAHEFLHPIVRLWFVQFFDSFITKTGIDKFDLVYNFRSAEMIIGNCDFAINYPYPQMPNNICVGPLSAKPAGKLTAELEALVNSSSHGVILVAFGSVYSFLHKWQVKAMAGAFGKLKHTVLWKLADTYDIDLAPNIKIIKWVPQNGILGHPNTKLFISHVGQNSLLEACYHGVPVLAVPRALDQLQNSILISDRVKMGDSVDISQAKEDDWFQTIENLLSNKSYAVNAKRVSRLIRSRSKSPVELAGDLIEYVIDNDYDMSHLKSRGPDLPWHVVHLYDVYAFILLVIVVVVLFVYFVSRKCLNLLFRRKDKRD